MKYRYNFTILLSYCICLIKVATGQEAGVKDTLAPKKYSVIYMNTWESNPNDKTPNEKLYCDTIVTHLFDTIRPAGGYDLGYVQDTSMIALLHPYFVKIFCRPGDTLHPSYVSYMKRASGRSYDVKSRIQDEVRKDTNFLWKYSGRQIRHLEGCKLEPLPVYYLSANVALYKQHENLSDYFTLDSSNFIFKLVKNNHLVGLFVVEEKGNIYPIMQLDRNWYETALPYTYLKDSLKKTQVIGISPHLTIERDYIHSKGYKFKFGYVQNGHLVIAEKYEHSDYGNGKRITQPIEESDLRYIERHYKKEENQETLQKVISDACIDIITEMKKK